MGGPSKIWMPFAGRPVLEWTLTRFVAAGVTRGVVVAQEDDHETIRQMTHRLGMTIAVTAGGAERYLSVVRGLAALSEVQPDSVVLIHDAARFLVPAEVIRRVAEAAAEHGAALPVLDVVDTVKIVDEGEQVRETVPRESLRLAQTPQGFKKHIIDQAYARWTASRVPTDDAEVAEAAGFAVQAVRGDRVNQKLTRPEDVAWLEAMLKGGMSDNPDWSRI